MPVPDGFITTANKVTFTDFAGDLLVMRAFASDGGAPAIKISTLGNGEGGVVIYVPLNCVTELIESLQHLRNRARELADSEHNATP